MSAAERPPAPAADQEPRGFLILAEAPTRTRRAPRPKQLRLTPDADECGSTDTLDVPLAR